MDIIFYNNFANGDIHVSRSFIQDIMNKLPDNNYYYYQHPQKIKCFLLGDIENLKPYEGKLPCNPDKTIERMQDSLLINTWYGAGKYKFFNKAATVHGLGGVSMYTLFEVFKEVYRTLEIPMAGITEYYPKINFENLDTSNVDDFVSQNLQKKVLVSSGNVTSGQAPNFDFAPILKNLCANNPNILFISTNELELPYENFVRAEKITKKSCDLNELSYLSTFCDVVVGRSSGPYTFSLIKENVFNPKKTMICFTHDQHLSLGLKEGVYSCKLVWSKQFAKAAQIIQDNL